MNGSATFCEAPSEWGPCQQEPIKDGVCGYHWHRDQGKPAADSYYEKKVVLGLVDPTDHYLGQTEVKAMFSGRPRHDGRRIDAYTKI